MTLETGVRPYEESPPTEVTFGFESPVPNIVSPPSNTPNPASIELPPSHPVVLPPLGEITEGEGISRAIIVNKPVTILVSFGRGDVKGGDVWLSNEPRTRPTKYRMMRPPSAEKTG